MKRCCYQYLVLLSVIFCKNTAAQTSWHYLRNAGLDTYLSGTKWPRYEDVYFIDSNVGFAVNLNNAIFKTVNSGQSWKVKNDIFSKNVPFRSIEFLDGGKTGIAGGLDGSIFRTTDSGETWVDISSTISVSSEGDRAMCGLSHQGKRFFGVGWWGAQIARFFRSDDEGATWSVSAIDTSLAHGLVDVVFLSPDTGFASGVGKINGGMRPGPPQESVVLKTTDGGAHWTKVFSDTTIGGRIWKLQFISRQLAFGSIEPYYRDTVAMIRSLDGGNTWKIMGTGFRGAHNAGFVVTQGIGFRTPAHGWLGGYYVGIYETKDGGLTWDSLGFGVNVNRIFVLDSNHVFAGGKLVYRYGYDISPLAIATPDNSVAPPHHLYPVTPNPSGGKVRIAFDLKTTTNVVLEVAAIDGRQTWRVAAGRMKAGHYVYDWSDAGAAAGNYMVWLGTDEIPITQKFVLLR